MIVEVRAYRRFGHGGPTILRNEPQPGGQPTA